MNHFTWHRDISIDTQIRSQLRLITDIILKNVSDVKSILLTGGFGKGEGSIIKTIDGKIMCLRDFDIAVIVSRIPQERTVQHLQDQICRSLDIDNPKNMLFRFFNFVVDIKFLRKRDLIYRDIWFVDLKSASQLLYGEDIRNSIPWTKEDVPLSSGLRILFEKVCGLLGFFSYGYLRSEKPSKETSELLIFECYKTFIEICTALCIFAGRYEPKYTDRAKILEELYHDRFPELAEALPDLPTRVATYTNFKLNPDFTKINENPIELWFFTRDCLGTILRFYITRYLNSNIPSWEINYNKTLARHYYKPFLDALMSTKLKTSNRTLLDIISFLYQVLTNVEYSYVVTRNIGVPYLQPLRRCYISPSLKFFQAGIKILFSLNRDGSTEKQLLEMAANELSQCIPIELSTLDISEWDNLRKHFLKAYSLYRGYHFAK